MRLPQFWGKNDLLQLNEFNGNSTDSTVNHIELVPGEKAQPGSYIRHTALWCAPLIFDKIEGF